MSVEQREVKMHGQTYVVEAVEIVGTNAKRYVAYERTTGGWKSISHGTIYRPQDYVGMWGSVATRKPDKKVLAGIRNVSLRHEIIRRHYRDVAKLEELIVREAFPEARDASWQGGSLVL